MPLDLNLRADASDSAAAYAAADRFSQPVLDTLFVESTWERLLAAGRPYQEHSSPRDTIFRKTHADDW